MKVYSILNNYQIGSYPHQVYEVKIYREERLDKYHTIVFWELEDNFQRRLLVKACGDRDYRVKDVVETEEFYIEYCKNIYNKK